MHLELKRGTPERDSSSAEHEEGSSIGNPETCLPKVNQFLPNDNKQNTKYVFSVVIGKKSVCQGDKCPLIKRGMTPNPKGGGKITSNIC